MKNHDCSLHYKDSCSQCLYELELERDRWKRWANRLVGALDSNLVPENALQAIARLKTDRDEWKRRAEKTEAKYEKWSQSVVSMRHADDLAEERDALAVQNEAPREALLGLLRFATKTEVERDEAQEGVVKKVAKAINLDLPAAAKLAEARERVCDLILEQSQGHEAGLGNGQALDTAIMELRKLESSKS